MANETTTDTVIVAVDGSDQSHEAFDFYTDHLHRAGNQVILVHAMEAPSSMPTRDETYDPTRTTQSGTKKQQELQTFFAEKFKELGMAGKFISDIANKPGEFVVSTAKKYQADYVVMGTRGLGKLKRTLMGSVSDFVVHNAQCPVMICRKK